MREARLQNKTVPENILNLVDVSDILYFFLFLLGGKGGGVRAGGRGGGVSIKIEGGGGEVLQGGGVGEGRAPGECLWGGGGGLNIFFRGRNAHQVNRYGKLFENRLKDPKNDPKRVRRILSPSHTA